MKAAVLTLVLVTTIVSSAYIFVNKDPVKSNVQVISQQDTKIDKESPRDTFEYFLSGVGEAKLATVKKHFETFNKLQGQDQQANLDLFNRYLQYRQALDGLDEKNLKQLDLNALKRLDKQLTELQSKFFTSEERSRMFAEEVQFRHLAMRQLELKQMATGTDDFDNLWQQEIETLSPTMQKSYQNARLLGQLQRTSELSGQERYLKQQELVGTEAADRLVKLQSERAEFKNTFDRYMAQSKTILADSSISIEERKQAVKALRQSMFSSEQQRRVIALGSL